VTRQAVVIGGGIGGLATAAALGRDGWQVCVHESDPALPLTGTALGIWPAALRALDAIGVVGRVRRLGVPQRIGEFRRPDGSLIAAMDTDRLRRRTGDDVHLLSRPALLAILYQAAAGCAEVRFGAPVERLGDLPPGADLIVAADGVFSRIRGELLGPAYRARPSGTTAWRGVVEDMPTDRLVEFWGRGAKFGVTPQEGSRTNWYAAAPTATATDLERLFGGWAPPVRTVLDAVAGSDVLRHDIQVVPPLPTFVRDNVALVGDSAHAMTPDLGRGACEAIIDAVSLARHLREAPTLAAGLHRYDRERRPVTQRVARISGWAARLGQARHVLPLRDRLLWASTRIGPPA
jgi:2-polyprenyl-6-methoxyphenol hydroxylase-like FAD-dependent oxidoreductase